MPPSKHQKQGGGWLGMGRRRAEDEHALPAPEAAPDPIRDPGVDDTDVPPPTAQPAPPLGDPQSSEGTESSEGREDVDGAGDLAREPADDDEPVESFEEQERAEEQAEARLMVDGEPGEELADDPAAIPLPADAEPPAELDSPLASQAVHPDERIAEPMPNDPAPTPSLAESDTATSSVASSPEDSAPEDSAPELEPAIEEAAPAARQPTTDDLEKLVGGASTDPHALLGAHPSGDEVVVRALRPDAVAVTVLSGDERVPATQVHHAGVWEALLPGGQVRDYRVEVEYGSGTYTQDDPYRYLPTLGEVDQHLIREGRHERLWEVLGSHVRDYAGADAPVRGTSFAVWAPNALGVRVAGDFNFWDGRANPMRLLGSSGVWELFVPDVGDGALYKYQVLGADGQWREKADPMARRTQVPPDTASVVTVSQHDWSDDAWVEQRSRTAWHAAPMSIYEIHLGSWRQGLDYRALADELIPYLQETGFTHVEMLPTAEHPFGGSWGYQVSAYYAPTARFGTPDDFRYLVDQLHQAGIGVLVDWVPAHFPKDAWALGRFDGTPLYEHPDPHRGEQLDWGTYVFDFGRHEVRNFLVANALFWLEEFHIDGLRVDAVASMLYLDYSRPEGGWTPNIHGGRENLEAVQFLQEANATVYKHFPGVVMIAEESTSWPGVTRSTHLGGLGFGFKWNMGWMHDTLDYLARPPVYRSYHHHQMTFSMMYAYSENFVLPISHDEVVHGKGSLLRKMPGDRWQQLANLRALLAFMWAHPGKQLLFMGSEFGQESEWSEGRSLDWWLLDNPDHRGVQHLVRDLNRTYLDTAALWSRDTDPAGFAWIDANDAGNNTFSFLRVGDDGSELACVVNFSGTPIPGYRLGLPHAGRWDEVLNTDAEVYAGSGVGNYGGVDAERVEHHGQPASAELTLPPLGALWLRSAR